MKDFCLFLMIFIAGIMAGYAWCLWHEKQPVFTRFIAVEQASEFNRLCRKHGEINTIDGGQNETSNFINR